jgi:hypothetical protein
LFLFFPAQPEKYEPPLFDFCKKIKQQNSQSLHIAWQSRAIFISVV